MMLFYSLGNCKMNNRVDIAGPYLALVLVLSVRLISSSCNSDVGPAGDSDCFLDSPSYSQYQCGTCLSNQYIQQKSSGKLRCRNSTSVFCYYQCMLEVHGRDSGQVYDDCLCAAGSVVKPSRLSPDCLSPNGTDCTWYRRCLAVQYPCAGQAAYALDYGEHFCKIYEKNLKLFSADGQKWIGAVRKCLQVQLAPVLRFCSQPPYTCDQVKQRAFDTHTPCYLKPYQGLSLCNLTCHDFLQIF